MANNETADAETIVSELPGVDITPDDSIVPVYLVPLTADEAAEREQWAKEQAERDIAETQKAEHRASALEKLAALGLTIDEIGALTN